MRGEVLQYDSVAQKGLIAGYDGLRYAFAEMVGGTHARPGQKVEFEEAEGAALSVRPFVDRFDVGEQTPSGLSLWQCFVRCMTLKYASFKGRATRREYWSFALFSILFQAAAIAAGIGLQEMAGGFDTGGGFPIVAALLIGAAVLGFLLPGVGVAVRRFHDIGLSGWLFLLALVANALPVVGVVASIAILVIALIPSQGVVNKYGPPPGH